MSPEQVRSFRLALPPLDEQAAIVEHLEEATASEHAATSMANQEINLLNEYRTRLIADVVTGKLDVREAAAGLPEEAAEVLPFDDCELTSACDEGVTLVHEMDL